MENEHRLLKERLHKGQALLEQLQSLLLKADVEEVSEDGVDIKDDGNGHHHHSHHREQALLLVGEALAELLEVKPRFERVVNVNGGRWQALFRELFNNNSQALALTDANGLILQCNMAAAEFLGHDTEDLIGKLFVTLVAREDQRALHKLMARLRLMSHVCQE